MSQLTNSETDYANKKRRSRREMFLEKMDELTPWARLEKKQELVDEALISEHQSIKSTSYHHQLGFSEVP